MGRAEEILTDKNGLRKVKSTDDIVKMWEASYHSSKIFRLSNGFFIPREDLEKQLKNELSEKAGIKCEKSCGTKHQFCDVSFYKDGVIVVNLPHNRLLAAYT